MSAADETYTTYQRAIHNEALLPTVDHNHFEDDEIQQKLLLNTLYTKLCVEHETSHGGDHELFLHLDEGVSTYICVYSRLHLICFFFWHSYHIETRHLNI